jgi:CO dehydrogenase maturation factor
VRGLIGGSDLRAREAVVLDMEASLEHMRRGTVEHVEMMLMVTEPYFRSLETTGRLAELAADMGIPRLAAVANKVRNGEEELAILDYCRRRSIELMDVIPFDPEVTRADNAGSSLLDVAPTSDAAQHICALARTLDQVEVM